MKIGEDADKRNGIVSLSFSGENGSFRQFFSSSQEDAVSIFAACLHVSEASTPLLVSAPHMDDIVCNKPITGGGDNMEKRLAVLEAEVSHIKADITEIKSDQRNLISGMADIKADVKVIIQKVLDINGKISTKASEDFVEKKAGQIKIWMLGLLLVSIAMPAISFLLNLYLEAKAS